MADLNLSNIGDRIAGNVQDFINDKAGGLTAGIEQFLGTGLIANKSNLYFDNKQKLVFPLDNQDDYKAKIRFTVVRVDPPAIEADIEDATKKATQALDQTIGSDRPGGATDVGVAEDKSITQKTVGTTAELYLPAALNISDGVDFENIDLGRSGAAGVAALQAGSGVTEAVGKAAMEGLSGFKDLFTGSLNSDVARLGAIGAAGVVSDTASGAARSAFQVTTNPNTRSLFKSAQLRNFSFTFSMIPTSVQEQDAMKNIIKFFRHELYPETISVKGIPIGYKFPNQFDIQVRYRSKTIATKFLPCYLTSFAATYNPSNMSFMRDGGFNQIDITMSFTEAETLDKAKIAEGY